MTIDTAKEREHLRDPDVDHLLTAHRYLDVIDAQAAEIERLREQVTDLQTRNWELREALSEYRRRVRPDLWEREP